MRSDWDQGGMGPPPLVLRGMPGEGGDIENHTNSKRAALGRGGGKRPGPARYIKEGGGCSQHSPGGCSPLRGAWLEAEAQ